MMRQLKKKVLIWSTLFLIHTYGVSGYETGQVDNRVKIINLPKKCTISIYSINGLLIRQIKKDAETTEYEWDLKNRFTASLLLLGYIIHIDAQELVKKLLNGLDQ